MTKPVYINAPGQLAIDANGNLTAKGNPMPTNVKAMTPSQLKAEENALIARADSQKRGMTPTELKRFEELEQEKQSKDRLHNEAAVVAARKAGQLARQRDDQARRAAASEVVPITSRSNQPDQVDRSDAIRQRHAARKAAGK